MQFGLDVPTTDAYADPRALAELAADAEAAGWDGFFVWDVLHGVDPWVALTAIALRTLRVRIGLMVLPLARHRPWLAAKRLADLDRLSGGRVVCTVGLGYEERDFTQFGEAGEPAARAAKLDEGLAVMDGLWRQDQISFGGDHYVLHDAALAARPTQRPRIPLWVAGGWPSRAPLRRAARWDGLCLMSVNTKERRWLTLEEFHEAVAYTRAQRAVDEPFDIIMSGELAEDRAAAVEQSEAFREAGATWWIEEGLGWTLEEFRERVRRGPPGGGPR